MQVREIMAPQTLTIAPGATIADAASAMVAREARCAVVVDGPDEMVGMLCEADVVRAAAQGQDPRAATVRAHMQMRVPAVTPEVEVDELARRMTEEGFEYVPVVDGTTLVGVVSIRDVFLWSYRRHADGDATQTVVTIEPEGSNRV